MHDNARMDAQSDILLQDFRPRPALRVPETHVPRARVPAIDAHNHLGRWLSDWVRDDGGWVVPGRRRAARADGRDAASRRSSTSTAAGARSSRPTSTATTARTRAGSSRSATSTGRTLDDAAPPGRVAARLARRRRARAEGVEGPRARRHRRARARSCCPTTRGSHDVWAAAGELGLPVLIHTADPVAFWEPARRRATSASRSSARTPSGRSPTPRFPRWERLLDALETVVAAHPRTTFVGAHVCSCAEDLARVDRMLVRAPEPHARRRAPGSASSAASRAPRAG